MQITAYFIVTTVTAAVMILSLLFGLKKVSGSAAGYALKILFVLTLSFCSLSVSNLITAPEGLKIFLHELKFSGAAVAPVLLCFEYIDYAGRQDLIKQRYRKFFYIVPVITAALAVTSPLHRLFRADVYVYRSGGEYIVGTGGIGPWFLVHICYSYLVFLLGFAVMVGVMFKKPKAYRRQIGLLSLVGLLPSFSAFFYFSGVFGIGGETDIVLILFAVSAVINYLILTEDKDRKRLYMVRDLAVKYISYPIIIFDYRGLLVDMNPAAAGVLSAPDISAPVVGETNFEEFIRNILSPGTKLPRGEEAEALIGEKYFNLSLKTIYGRNNMPSSTVVLLSDITKFKKSFNELKYLTEHDYFTGLLNRQAFRDRVNNIPARDLPAAIVRVHLRSLKLITNIFGNDYADEIVQTAVRELSAFCDEESVARLDKGDMLFILKKSGEEEAKEVSQKIQARFKAFEERGFPMAALMGYSVRKSEFESYDRNIEETEAMLTDPGKYPPLSIIRANLTKRLGRTESGIAETEALCLKIAAGMELPPRQLKSLSLLCVVSDIGLLAYPKEFLRKKGNFSNREWEEYKRHPFKGYTIVKSSGIFEDVAEEILAHHERFDGYGYPNGLKGDEIPLLSRILSAAEGYLDAGGPEENAGARLNFYSNTKYDPVVVEALTKAVKI